MGTEHSGGACGAGDRADGFFLHITTGADNTNNVLALAFGVLIVFLVIGGSLWIMANLNHNMMPMDQFMQMQR
jgi:cytochrome o ubiquinol oxidase operon protein cyoD